MFFHDTQCPLCRKTITKEDLNRHASTPLADHNILECPECKVRSSYDPRLTCPRCGGEAKLHVDKDAGSGGSYSGAEMLKMKESLEYVKCGSSDCDYHVLAKDHQEP